MRTQAATSALLTHPGVIAVVRTQQPEQVLPLCAAPAGRRQNLG